MKKKNLFIVLGVIILILVIAIGLFTYFYNKDVTEDSKRFKSEYESLNGEETVSGKAYRKISIPRNNPFVFISAEDLATKIDEKETFVVYFGFNSCPWCRSILPTLIEVLKENKINKVYYVDVKSIRDVKKVTNGEVVDDTKGTDGYYALIEKLASVLSDYTITDENGKSYDTLEKRIYAPNVVVVINGEAKGLASGNSDKQTDGYMELTDEMINDTRNTYNELFKLLKEDDTCSLNSKC